MRKTVIILSMFAIITSSCVTGKNYYSEISRVYFTDLSGRELKETLSGMPIRICIESKKTGIPIAGKLTKSELRKVEFAIKAPKDRKFKGGSDRLHFEVKVNRKGKACQQVTIEYEPDEVE